MYSENWVNSFEDIVGKDTLRSPSNISFAESGTMTSFSLHNSNTRFLCIAHAWASIVQDWVPESAPHLLPTLEQGFGLTLTPGYNQDVDACFDQQSTEYSENKACTKKIAEDSCYSPSVVGAILARQATEVGRRDGWNMFGDINSDGSPCLSNCHRYTDPTGYLPVNFPGADDSLSHRWQPLMENDGRGYFSRQEHVTPHIGKLAKPAILSRSAFERKISELTDPGYNYPEEAAVVLQRMNTLGDEKKRLLVEFFDDKFNVILAGEFDFS